MKQTLEQFLATHPETPLQRHPNDGVQVFSRDPALWDLADYRVDAALSGPSVWLRPFFINRPSIYRETGVKAGTASRHHDQGSVAFRQSWFRRARALEFHRDIVQKAFDDGYREGAAYPAR